MTTNSRRDEKYTHAVRREPFPKVFQLFDGRIGRQNVDDAKIIERVHRLVGFVRRLQPTLVLVEYKLLSVARVYFGQVERFCEALWIRCAHRTLHGDRFGRPCALVLGVFPADGRYRRLSRHPSAQTPCQATPIAYRKHLERVTADLVSVAPLDEVYADQQAVIHDVDRL